jgi:hypothetical protein
MAFSIDQRGKVSEARDRQGGPAFTRVHVVTLFGAALTPLDPVAFLLGPQFQRTVLAIA